MGFNCTLCGLCCHSVGDVIASGKESPFYEMVKDFPFKTDEKGVCEKLDRKTNLCTVYDERPEICKVDKVYERYYADVLSRQDYYRLNEEACKILQEEAEVMNQKPDRSKPAQTE